jgi:predicted dehydrogenase
MSNRTTRRSFLKSFAAAGAAFPLILASRARGQAANDAVNVGFVAAGGIAGSHIDAMSRLGANCVCYCDVDTRRMGKAAEKWPQAKAYQDYRKMLDAHHDELDAVMVGTPDHHHFPASIMAMQYGLHCYTQKPLTQTPWEARQLALAAQRYPKLATQMGNQGHAGEGWRIFIEWVRSGAIGDVVEYHVWTNRPWWPQGEERPDGQDPIPAELDWDCWIGPAKPRPYKDKLYHPFAWRGRRDFGAGSLGDMACHTMDGMFWLLDPGYPIVIEPVVMNKPAVDTFPSSAVIKWTFPAKANRPGFTVFWYDGGLKPPRPEDLEPGRELPETGNLVIGTKGKIIISGDYGDGLDFIPLARKEELGGSPPRVMERSPGHFEEWIAQIKGDAKIRAMSNFGYAGPMTETILLGNIACQVGQPIEYDGANFRVTNLPDANALLTRTYREGWDLLKA